jgi:alpha-L-fucosidase 2
MRKIAIAMLTLAASVAGQHPVDRYNVVWDSPSRTAMGSMPTGNGDIGLNVWVEENGDLLFYIGKTDAWSEVGSLLKLGRVRLRLSPNPFAAGQPFEQTLGLRNGEIRVRAGKPESQARISVWVDAVYPIIRVDAETAQPSEVQVIYERWRTQQRQLEGDEVHSAHGLEGGPEPLVSYGDSIQLEGEDSVIWYHRNARSAFPSIMKLQGLTEVGVDDPLLNRTFGAAMNGDDLVRMNPTTLRSKTASRKHGVNIYALTATTGSSEDWVREMQSLIARLGPMKPEHRRSSHDKWWQDFWDRSYVRITGGEEQHRVSQAYALQRFINACGGRGAYPIKSNGSIFTVDTKAGETTYDADYRRWGGVYRFRDARLIYWPMLASGDHDLMQPFFRMYLDARSLAQRRTRLYFNHEGVFFPETMYFWGAYANSDYGWKREGKPLSHVESTDIRHYFSNSLELLAMMLEYGRYREDKQFARSIAQLAEGVIDFYDKHYERDSGGRLRFASGQTVSPMPEIAGLRYVLAMLLADKVPITKQASNTARKLLDQLPGIPLKEGSTLRALASEGRNEDNTELHAVFPYRLFGVEKPDLDVARYTFEKRKRVNAGAWRLDAIQAAYLGLAFQARDIVEEIFCAPNPEMRFPAFWGPKPGWTPDQDHGSVAMMALQAMLLQADGEKLYVAPAWPGDWDVDFKLNAPGGTVVEGSIKDGKIKALKTTPEKRLADIQRFEPQ